MPGQDPSPPLEALRQIVRREADLGAAMARISKDGRNFVGGFFKGYAAACEIARGALLAELRRQAAGRGIAWTDDRRMEKRGGKPAGMWFWADRRTTVNTRRGPTETWLWSAPRPSELDALEDALARGGAGGYKKTTARRQGLVVGFDETRHPERAPQGSDMPDETNDGEERLYGALRDIVRRHDETMARMSRVGRDADNFVGGFLKGFGQAADIARAAVVEELRRRAEARGVVWTDDRRTANRRNDEARRETDARNDRRLNLPNTARPWFWADRKAVVETPSGPRLSWQWSQPFAAEMACLEDALANARTPDGGAE